MPTRHVVLTDHQTTKNDLRAVTGTMNLEALVLADLRLAACIGQA